LALVVKSKPVGFSAPGTSSTDCVEFAAERASVA
jgi:hypothetical protein